MCRPGVGLMGCSAPWQVQAAVDLTITDEQLRNGEESGNRMLKLCLSDGRQQLFGIEYRRLPSLQSNPPCGLKLVLHNVAVRRGVLLLTPANTCVVGGGVAAAAPAAPVGAAVPSGGGAPSHAHAGVARAPPVVIDLVPATGALAGGKQPPGLQPPGLQPPGIQPPGIQPPGIQPPGIHPFFGGARGAGGAAAVCGAGSQQRERAAAAAAAG